MVRSIFLAAVLILALAQSLSAESLTFMTLNINGGEAEPAEPTNRARLTVDSIGPVDVLGLQEVNSEEQVKAVECALGLDHYVISDLSPPPNITGA